MTILETLQSTLGGSAHAQPEGLVVMVMASLLSGSVLGGHTADRQQEASYFPTLRDEWATF